MSASVAVVTSVHPPDDPRIRLKTVGTLVDAGWDVTYVAPDPGPVDVDGFRWVGVRGHRSSRTAAAARLMASLDADVTVVHDPELVPFAMALALRRGKCRVVFDLHEDLPSQLLTRERTPPAFRRPSAAAARMMLRAAERSLTVTLAEPNYAHLFTSPHPVFENRPVMGSLPFVEPDASGVVYVGDISRARGVPLLLDAVGRLAEDRSLTLIGRCPQPLEAELRAQADRLDIRLDLPGFLPYARAWAVAARHRVGVSPLLDRPNYRASLPTKIDEYRAVGLVAVTSDLPGSVAAIEGSEAAIAFPAGDAEALAGALAMARQEPRRAAAAIEEAPDVRRNRQWDADGFVSFYESLITDDH